MMTYPMSKHCTENHHHYYKYFSPVDQRNVNTNSMHVHYIQCQSKHEENAYVIACVSDNNMMRQRERKREKEREMMRER